MTLRSKIEIFIRDFIFQSLVFYFVLLSPLGNIKEGFTSNSCSLFQEWIKDAANGDYPVLYFLRSLVLGYLFICLLYLVNMLLNTYILRFNKFRYGEDDYFAFKLFFLLITNGLYMFLLMVLLNGYLYLAFSLPVIISIISYIIWIAKKERSCHSSK